MLCLIMLRYVMFFIQESGEHDMFNSCQLQPNKRSMKLEVATVPEALEKNLTNSTPAPVGFASLCNNMQ